MSIERTITQDKTVQAEPSNWSGTLPDTKIALDLEMKQIREAERLKNEPGELHRDPLNFINENSTPRERDLANYLMDDGGILESADRTIMTAWRAIDNLSFDYRENKFGVNNNLYVSITGKNDFILRTPDLLVKYENGKLSTVDLRITEDGLHPVYTELEDIKRLSPKIIRALDQINQRGKQL